MSKDFKLNNTSKQLFESTYWPNIKKILEKYFDEWFEDEPFDKIILSMNDVKKKIFEFYEKYKDNYEFDDLLNINSKHCAKSCICCINCYCCYNCLLCENSEGCENLFKCSDCKSCKWCKYCQKCKYCTSCESCNSCDSCIICDFCDKCEVCDDCQNLKNCR